MTIRFHPRLTAMLVVMLAVAWLGQTPAATASQDLNPRFSADGRSFTIITAGFEEFRATWSVTVQRDGSPERVLASTDGLVIPGPVTTVRFPEENIELLFQMESRGDAPAVITNEVQTITINANGSTITVTEPIEFSGASFLAGYNQENKTFTQQFNGPVTVADSAVLGISTARNSSGALAPTLELNDSTIVTGTGKRFVRLLVNPD
jgi:hypothetical protein